MDLKGVTVSVGQQEDKLSKEWTVDRLSAEDDDEVKIGD